MSKNKNKAFFYKNASFPKHMAANNRLPCYADGHFTMN